jgi:hypothetical protein
MVDPHLRLVADARLQDLSVVLHALRLALLGRSGLELRVGVTSAEHVGRHCGW